MNNNNFNDMQNTAPVPQVPAQQPEAQPYSVNNVPVQPGYTQAQPVTPQPDAAQPYTVNSVPVQSPPPQYQQQAYPPPAAYQQPVYQQPKPKDPGRDMGTASLILGLISIFGGFTAVIGLGCAVGGFVCAKKSKDATTAAGLVPGTEQKAGFICSIVGMVISGVALLFYLVTVIIPLIFSIIVTFLGLLSIPFMAMSSYIPFIPFLM